MEGILKVRKEEERQCEMEVQRIQALIQGVLTRLNQISTEQSSWREAYTKIDATHAWLLLIENYLLALEQEWTWQTQTRTTLEQESEVAHVKLRAAYKARRQVEHLKEKEKRDYLQKLHKLIEKEMSEMTILRFTHQQMKQEEEVA